MPGWTKSNLPGSVADPYAHWADETNYAYLFAHEANAEQQRFPVIIELQNGFTAQEFAVTVARKKHWARFIQVDDLYARPPRGLETASHCTGSVTREFFSEELPRDLRESVQRYELGLPVPTYATPAPLKPKVVATSRKKTSGNKKSLAQSPVVTAVIDDGMAFAHERFRSGALGTRVEFFWNQDNAVELTRAQIENALTGCTYGGVVDEDELYGATGQINYGQSGHKPIAQRAAHGSHVMDFAAGADPANPPASRPVILVQLPIATTADTSGATLAPQVLDGLRYILNRADTLLPAPARVAVNLSYGTNAGPHDGSSVLEKAIDELIALRNGRLQIVLPAGNSHLARCHARFDLGREREQVLQWRLQPDDHTPSFQEIWLPAPTKTNKREVQIKVIPPGGEASDWVREGEEHVWQPVNDILCKVLYLPADATRARAMIFIAVAPTATLHPTRNVAPSGTWKIRVRNRAANTVTVDAWIQRDDTPFGYPRRGRQSRFTDSDYAYRDEAGRYVETDNASYIKRTGTTNAIATGAMPIVLGGFRRKDQRAVWYSASGSKVTVYGGVAIRGPDALAVTDDSPAADGLLASGSRTGSTVVLNGTSVAAPQITRWVADQLAQNYPSNRAAVAAQAVAPSAPNPPIPPERGGAGLIDLPPLVDRRIEK